MDLRRRISYQWQMFILMAVSVWLLILGMGYWQYRTEINNRKAAIYRQLGQINDRIVYAFDRNHDLRPYIDFLGNYFTASDKPNFYGSNISNIELADTINSSIFDKLRVSVYVDGQLVHNVGEVILPESGEVTNGKTDDENFYFRSNEQLLRGHKIQIFTVLPYDENINRAVLPNRKIWLAILALALAMTVAAYFMSQYFGKNIKILRLFAERAATDPNFIPSMDYPHDELGEISRQIIHMYNERSKTVLKLKREHKVALQAIEDKGRMKRQLTNNINHELKTPIGVVKGYLDTIIDNPDMDARSRDHFLLKAREHINRLVNLIADISAITRLEEGSGMISTEELNYHDVVYSIASDIEESGAAGHLEFVYDVPMECMVVGNYNLLSGMLINLVKNATLYSKGTECGVKLTGEDDKFYYFKFFDNGIGVGEEHLPHLFERFYRVDNGRSRKSGGTGLGLPIVQNTILAHGGTIDVRNAADGGLEFLYSLPKAVHA